MIVKKKKKNPWEKLVSCSKGISPEMPSKRLSEAGEGQVELFKQTLLPSPWSILFSLQRQKLNLLYPPHLWFTVVCDTWGVIYCWAQA